MSEGENTVNDLTLPVLISIRDGITATNARLDRLEAGITGVHARLDNLIATAGGAERHQNERIDELEERVSKLERGTPRSRRPTSPRGRR